MWEESDLFGILAMCFCASVFSSIPPLRCCARGLDPVVLVAMMFNCGFVAG